MEALMLTAKRSSSSRSLHRVCGGVLRFRLSSASFNTGSYERAERDNARVEAMNQSVPQEVRLSNEDMEGADKAEELAGKMRQAAGKTAEFVADAAAEGTRRVALTADNVGETMGKIKDKIVGDDGEVKVAGNENERIGNAKPGTVSELRGNAGGGGYDKNAY